MSHKYEIDDDHEWTDEQEPDPPERGSVEVQNHVVRVNDERDSIDDYNGFVWRFIVEDGTITAVDQEHYCLGPGHTDPMGFRRWKDVPGPVKRAALSAINGTEEEHVDHAEIDKVGMP